MIATRLAPNQSIIKPFEGNDGLRKLYNHQWVYQQYRNYVRKQSEGPKHQRSPVFSNFQFFLEWYNLNGLDYLVDPWGSLMMPHDPKKPQQLFPLAPKTLVSGVEQHWLRIKPVGRGGQKLPYLYGCNIWEIPSVNNRYYRLRGDIEILKDLILNRQVYPFFKTSLFGPALALPTIEQICEDYYASI